MMCVMTTRTYTPSKINDLGPIAGLTRDQTSGPQSDFIMQLPNGHIQEQGDSASGPILGNPGGQHI